MKWLIALAALVLFMTPAFAQYSTDGIIGYWNLTTGASVVGDTLAIGNARQTQGISGAGLLAGVLNWYSAGFNFAWNSTFEGLFSPYETKQFTETAWVKILSPPSSIEDIVGIYESSGCGGDLWNTYFDTSSAITASIYWDDCTLNSAVTSALNTGQWYYYAAWFNGTAMNITVYNETDFVESVQSDFTEKTLYTSFSPFGIGFTGLGNAGFEGVIDEVLYYNRTLNYTEISDIWSYTKSLNEPYLDVDPPVVEIGSPAFNGHYSSAPIGYGGNIFENVNLDTCSYFFDGVSNNLPCSGNSLPLGGNLNPAVDGHYYFEAHANDSAGNAAMGNVSFTYDTTAPVPVIFSPVGNQIAGTHDINFTVGDIDPEHCEIYVNGTLISATSCDNTTFSFPSGNYTVEVIVYDFIPLSGNASSTFEALVPDLTAPVVNITSLAWGAGMLDVNYTSSDDIAVDRCWYDFDTLSINLSIPNCQNFSIPISPAPHNITIFSNDTSGNIGNDSRSFDATDSVNPVVAISSPSGTYISGTVAVPVNFTASDDWLLDRCWYSYDNGTNTTLAGCSNISLAVTTGSHNLSIYSNDTSSNIGRGNSSFIVSAFVPPITGKVTGATGVTANAVIMIFSLIAALLGFLVMTSGIKSGDSKSIIYGFVIVIIAIIFAAVMYVAVN